MKLYYSTGACSLSPHIVLRELGLPFELVKVANGKTEAGADYKAVNPKGAVPCLELDDGQRITEGPAVVQYLADLRPASGLAPPAGTMERVRLQEWLNFTTSELHKRYGTLWSKAAQPEWKAAVREQLGGQLQHPAAQLASRPHLLGDRFTVADAYLFVVLSWSKWVEVDLSPFPALGAYLGRVAARPAVQAALKAEGLA